MLTRACARGFGARMPGAGWVLFAEKEVFAPLVVTAAEEAHEVTAGVKTEGARRTEELHAGFFGGAVAFAVVAGVAAGDEVFPSGFAGAGARDDVIEGHFAGGQGFVAVLADVAIAHEDVLARESAGLVGDAAVFKQADDGGHRQSPLGGMDGGRGHFFGRSDALQNEHKGAASRTDIDGLVTGV